MSWEAMRRHLLHVRALLRGEAVDIEGGMAQLLASSGLLPDRPIRTPLLLAAQGPKGRAVAKEIADDVRGQPTITDRALFRWRHPPVPPSARSSFSVHA